MASCAVAFSQGGSLIVVVRDQSASLSVGSFSPGESSKSQVNPSLSCAAAMATREYVSKDEQTAAFRALRSRPGNHVSFARI